VGGAGEGGGDSYTLWYRLYIEKGGRGGNGIAIPLLPSISHLVPVVIQ
jgi:hypothetical protein